MKLEFNRIEEWHRSGQTAWNVASGSVLDTSDGLTEPHQVSHLLGYLRHTALDHVHALKTLLADAGAQHTFAPYTLIRGSIEAASTALWILQDDDPRLIAQRALHLEYQNLWDQRRATKLVVEDANLDEERYPILRSVLERNNLSTAMVKKPLHVSKIIATAATVFALLASRLTWQMCSAAAHGRSWAQQFLTLFEAHEDDGTSKTLSGQLSSNQLAMTISLHNACDILDKARIVRNAYSRNSNHTGASFSSSPSKLHFVTKRLFTP